MDNFGRNFRVTVFGESHGWELGVVVDGVRPGIPLCEEDFLGDIKRRRAGGTGTTARVETDRPRIVSGTYRGYTTGAAVAVIFRNGDVRAGDYDRFSSHPRPSHADLTARVKYKGFNDPRGGGHLSGRLTLGLVAAGVIAKKMIPQVSFDTKVIKVGGSGDPDKFGDIIDDAMAAGDSVGGVVECVATGVGPGTGEPFFDSLESVAGHLLFSIPGVKGVEFGAGFAVADRRGSANNDPIADDRGRTATNNDGGVNGGIANGNPVVVRVAIKPTPSIAAAQDTYDFGAGEVRSLSIGGRHDACIALRAAVVAEAALAIAIAELYAEGDAFPARTAK